MKKLFNYAVKLLISLVILLILLYNIGFKEIYRVFSRFNVIYLVPTILIYLVSLILGNLNIKILVNCINSKIGFFRILKYYLLSWSFGLMIPGKLGEFSLVYFLKREGITIGQGMAISIIDKIITVIVLSLFAVVGFFMFLDPGSSLTLTLILIISISSFIFILLNNKIRSLIRKYVLRKYEKKFEGFGKTIYSYLSKNKQILLLNIVLTMIKWAVAVLIVYIILISFDIKIPFFYILVLDSAATMISLIPITINGLGVRESAAVFLYGFIGVPANIIVTIYIINSLVSYSIAGINILVISWKK